MEQQTQDLGPWYRQNWLWFVLTPLIAVFFVAGILIYFAITTADGVVKEDYYKVARGTTIDTTRQARAIALGIHGDILIDSLTGDVRLQLNSNQPLPDTLKLDLVHPTHQKYDQSLLLRTLNADGIYLGSLQAQLESKRYLLLSDLDESWRLHTEIYPPYDQQSFKLDSH